MHPILEPITAGIAVALINRYLISKYDFCYFCNVFTHDDEHEDISSSTTSINDADASTHTIHNTLHY